jgi:hypothetical protein
MGCWLALHEKNSLKFLLIRESCVKNNKKRKNNLTAHEVNNIIALSAYCWF